MASGDYLQYVHQHAFYLQMARAVVNGQVVDFNRIDTWLVVCEKYIDVVIVRYVLDEC